jgi:adenylate cyclase
VALTGGTFAWRELDAIRVKGRSQAVKIFEPLGEPDKVPLDAVLRAQTYSEGLACYRVRDFAGAAGKLSRFAADDPPAAQLLYRAKKLAQNPPGPDWEPVSAQDEK